MADAPNTDAAQESVPSEPTAPTSPATETEPGTQPDTGAQEGSETAPTPVREAMDPGQIRSQARARAMERAGQVRQEADAGGRPRDPATGQFVSPEGPESAPPSDDGSLGGDDAAEGATTGEGPGEGYVAIEVPEGHPLRTDRGTTVLHVPTDQETDVRTLLKHPARASELSAVRRELAATRAQLEAVESGAVPTWTEAHQQTYDDLKEAYDDDAAEAFKRGVEAQRREKMSQAGESAASRAEQVEKARDFASNVMSRAPSEFPFWQEDGTLANRMGTAIAAFARAVDAGIETPEPDRFFQFVRNGYRNDPQVAGPSVNGSSAPVDREAIKEELRTEILEEMGIQATDRRDRVRQNPMGRLSTGTPSGARALDPSGQPPGDEAGQSPGSIRRQLRERAIARGRGSAIG